MNTKDAKPRESGIELLKIITMFMVVIFHVIHTLTQKELMPTPYLLNLEQVTNNIQQLAVANLFNLGSLGNIIFFTCSAWFLLESQKINFKKVLYIIANVWIVNVIFLIIFKATNLFDIPIKTVITCLFPTTFELNWYITCYLLFYCIHLYLNKIIYSMSQKQLLITTIVMFIIYFGIDFIQPQGTYFYFSNLVFFISIYFIIAYMKLYLVKLTNNQTVNTLLLIIGIIGTLILLLFTNLLGQHIDYLNNKLLCWSKNNNPLLLLIAISLFNLFRQKKFYNKTINYISNLTLLIYIIHENLLVRTYIRPLIWQFLYDNIGYKYLLILIFAFAIVLFIVATILALIYKNTIQKIIYKICDKFYIFFSKFCNKILDKLLQLE